MSVNKFAITITDIITERDFKIEYLFRICTMVTNLVTSLEFEPIHFATTLCHFGRTWNGYVATQSFFSVALWRTVVQAALWSLRNAWAKMRREVVEMWNGLGRCPVLIPAVDLIDAVTTNKHEFYPSFICTLFYVFHLFSVHFVLISSHGKPV